MGGFKTYQFDITGLKSSLPYVAFSLAMQTARPFKVSDKVSPSGNPSLGSIKEYMGNNWLTSLGMRSVHSGIEIEFEECIISIHQPRNIVRTSLQGRDGTIKEYISDGDYEISIQAGISNYSNNEEGDSTGSHDYPREGLEDLILLLKSKEALEVQSDFLDLFGVESAVVVSYHLRQETHSNRQGIQIEMVSDTPYEIVLNQD